MNSVYGNVSPIFNLEPTVITNEIVRYMPYDGTHPLSIFLFFVFTLMVFVYGVPFVKGLYQSKEILSMKDFVLWSVGITGLLTTILFLI